MRGNLPPGAGQTALLLNGVGPSLQDVRRIEVKQLAPLLFSGILQRPDPRSARAVALLAESPIDLTLAVFRR
jgi:hypothetical protein